MYSFDPATGNVTCDSCAPSGEPPTSNVIGSQNGLFMTSDGRTFFSTVSSLVPQDTNEGEDVYEFVEGRPQLISSGTTAAATGNGFGALGNQTRPGLVAVSANGTDVYLATFDTFVGQDENGEAIKIYDARTGGGFPFLPPAAPCASADECHGPGAASPAAMASGTGSALGAGGNVHSVHKRHHNRHRKARKHNPAKKSKHPPSRRSRRVSRAGRSHR
jgi:hypothetical protein